MTLYHQHFQLSFKDKVFVSDEIHANNWRVETCN